MNKKEIIKVTDIIMSNDDSFDMVIMLKTAFPSLSQEIDKEVKRHTDSEDFEDSVRKKAKELFVADGHDLVHFGLPGSKDLKYYERARNMLNNEEG